MATCRKLHKYVYSDLHPLTERSWSREDDLRKQSYLVIEKVKGYVTSYEVCRSFYLCMLKYEQRIFVAQREYRADNAHGQRSPPMV